MRQVVPLYSPVQAYAVMAETVWPNIKALLMAGHRLVLEVREDKRTLAQNRLMWSVLGDLSDQVEWCGKRLKKPTPSRKKTCSTTRSIC